jgi:hypothetical protein
VPSCPGPDGDDDCTESCHEVAGGSWDCTEDDGDGAECSDGNYCTGTETCSGGLCAGSTGDPCAPLYGDDDCTGGCNGAAQDCSAPLEPVSSPCDDGIYCNGVDTCDALGCETHDGDPCEPAASVCDTNCTNWCNEGTGLCDDFDPAGTPCGNNLTQCVSWTCKGDGTCSN